MLCGMTIRFSCLKTILEFMQSQALFMTSFSKKLYWVNNKLNCPSNSIKTIAIPLNRSHLLIELVDEISLETSLATRDYDNSLAKRQG